MKTSRITSAAHSTAGYALLIVLVIGAVSALILASSVNWTINSANLNERNNCMTVNLAAAEAATEKVVARMMADCQKGGEAAVSANLSQYQALIPDEDSYWSGFEFSDGEGIAGQTWVGVVSNRSYVQLESQYSGLQGWATTYRVLSNARQTRGRFTTLTNAALQDIQIASIPLFQFAFFYNGSMTFTNTSGQVINGRTHANGDITFGNNSLISFGAPVTASGTIQRRGWSPFFGGGSPVQFNATPDYRTSVAQLCLPIGMNNTSTNLHKLIEIPPGGETITPASLSSERFYYKAGMVLTVDDMKVTFRLYPSGASNTWSVSMTNNMPLTSTNAFPFLSTNNSFWDQREQKQVRTMDIDIIKFGNWISNNVPPILYVADNRSVTSTNLFAVRLLYGTRLPTNGTSRGFTVVTPNPLYTKGDYNTSNTIPAALISDALTILSSRWEDNQYHHSWSDLNNAVSTTINAAVITGSLASGPPAASEVNNLPRLLEDWGNDDLTLTGSFVSLFRSQRALGSAATDAYQLPHRINFNFDTSFTNPAALPPGTPMLTVLLRARWANPSPDTTGF
jgi:hypothetical protein